MVLDAPRSALKLRTMALLWDGTGGETRLSP